MEGGVWGIVIIISAFMIQFFIFGLSGSIGVYNIEFLEYFKASASEVSLIAALNYGVFLGSGPIVSFLMTRFTCRKIAIAGTVIVTLGLLSVPLLPHLGVMYLTLGVFTGFGNSCAYITSHTLTGMYFDKYRSLATGVATSGSGLGGAFMPVLVGIFIEVYSWKGSFIIIAGICLHTFIFCCLLRSPPVLSKELVMVKELSECDGFDEKLDKTEHGKPKDVSGMEDNHEMSNVDTTNHFDFGGKLSWRPGAGYLSTENLHSRHAEENTSLMSEEVDVESRLEKSGDANPKLSSNSQVDECHVSNSLIQNGGSGKHSEVHKITSEVPESSRHIYIFKNYNFDIYFINNVFWNVGASILMTFVPEYMRLRGLTEMEAAWMMGAFGFGIFVGGITGGIIGNIKGMNRISLFIISCVLMGVTPCFLPFGTTIPFYACFLLLTGVLFGIILGLLIVVLTDLIGIESLGNGMGYLMLSNGLGTLTGPLFGGLIIDSTGNYDDCIYFSGITTAVSGVILTLIPLRRYFQCRKN